MRRNIARVKVNGVGLLKLSYGSEGSYILTPPKMSPKDSYVEAHMSFHTKDNRITFKITNVGDSKLDFNSLKKEAKTNGWWVSEKDIDMYKGRYESNELLSTKLVSWGLFAYDFSRDDFIEKVTAKTKTADEEFKKVIDLQPPEDRRAPYIAIYVSKNLKYNPEDLIDEVIKSPIDEHFVISDEINGDKYTFTLLVRYAKKLEGRKK